LFSRIYAKASRAFPRVHTNQIVKASSPTTEGTTTIDQPPNVLRVYFGLVR
jgi:hypothetical protein